MIRISNVKKYEAAFRLALGIGLAGSIASNPLVVYADEIVYEVTEENQEGKVVEVDAGTSVVENSPAPTITPDEVVDKNAGMTEMPEGKKEYGEDEFIDATNWSKEHDIDPNAGEHISDAVISELERKNGKPTPKPEVTPEPTPEEPTPEEPTEEVPSVEVVVEEAPVVETPVTIVEAPKPIPKTDGFDKLYYILMFGAPSVLAAGYGFIKGISKINSKLVADEPTKTR